MKLKGTYIIQSYTISVNIQYIVTTLTVCNKLLGKSGFEISSKSYHTKDYELLWF